MSSETILRQQIQQQKEALRGDIQKGTDQVPNKLNEQKTSIANKDKQMQQEFKESDEEWIGWKAGRATLYPSVLNNQNRSSGDKKKN